MFQIPHIHILLLVDTFLLFLRGYCLPWYNCNAETFLLFLRGYCLPWYNCNVETVKLFCKKNLIGFQLLRKILKAFINNNNNNNNNNNSNKF